MAGRTSNYEELYMITVMIITDSIKNNELIAASIIGGFENFMLFQHLMYWNVSRLSNHKSMISIFYYSD